MGITLNEAEKFREFYGRNVDQMPLLIAEGRTPLSFAGVMERRLIAKSSKDAWLNNYLFTGDGIVYGTDGSIVIAYDAKALKNLNSQSRLVNGALDLSGVDLKSIEGTRFTKSQLSKMVLGQDLTEKQARTHPIWLALARGDRELAKDYSGMVSESNGGRNMGVYLGSKQEVPTMRAWFAGRMLSWSHAGGYDDLDNDNGRLVGVASETQK